MSIIDLSEIPHMATVLTTVIYQTAILTIRIPLVKSVIAKEARQETHSRGKCYRADCGDPIPFEHTTPGDRRFSKSVDCRSRPEQAPFARLSTRPVGFAMTFLDAVACAAIPCREKLGEGKVEMAIDMTCGPPYYPSRSLRRLLDGGQMDNFG